MKNNGKWIVVSITLGVAALLTGAIVTTGVLPQEEERQGRAIGVVCRKME